MVKIYSKKDLDNAVEMLRDCLDARLVDGGYPAQISTRIPGYVIIADLHPAKEYYAPMLRIFLVEALLRSYFQAVDDFKDGVYETLEEAFWANYPEEL